MDIGGEVKFLVNYLIMIMINDFFLPKIDITLFRLMRRFYNFEK